MAEQEHRVLAVTLRNTITDEVIMAMGASPQRLVRKALTPILRLATHRFAQLVVPLRTSHKEDPFEVLLVQ